MHLSMHNWMRAEPIEVTIARLARYGYESLEISGEPKRYDTKEVKKSLDEHGVRCLGAVTLMFEGYHLPSPSAEVRANTVQYVKDCITMVKELEGELMTIVPGTVGKVNPDTTPEEEWTNAVDGMREIDAWSKREGVRIAVEPINRFETYFVSRASQALALAEATSEECGVCLDAFHLNIEEVDPFEAIKSAEGRLLDFHVADTNRFACGWGHWDWAKVVGTLREIGYDGALTVEFVAPVDRTPANPYPEMVETDLENLDISEEQKKFIVDHGSSILTEGFYSGQVKACADTLLPLIS
ncbi:MAG: sugar phosphate isomerase/epimerase family protein [Anaerolineales bacterium]|nr:sugar phosphate isomerase/epimerase family protein [Anaerolineales bacterium]